MGILLYFFSTCYIKNWFKQDLAAVGMLVLFYFMLIAWKLGRPSGLQQLYLPDCSKCFVWSWPAGFSFAVSSVCIPHVRIVVFFCFVFLNVIALKVIPVNQNSRLCSQAAIGVDLCPESLSSRKWNERTPAYKWNVSVKVCTPIPLTRSSISSPFWLPTAPIFLGACDENMRQHGTDTETNRCPWFLCFRPSFRVKANDCPWVRPEYFPSLSASLADPVM